MAFKKNSEFKYSFRGINRVIEEKGNTFMRLAEIAWLGPEEEASPEQIHLDLRKYSTDADGNERMMKGVSFMTKEGPNELVHTLLEEGYGESEKVLRIVKNRSDFNDAVRATYGESVSTGDDETFDLRDLI